MLDHDPYLKDMAVPLTSLRRQIRIECVRLAVCVASMTIVVFALAMVAK